MVPAWRRSSRRKILFLRSSRLPRTWLSTSAMVSTEPREASGEEGALAAAYVAACCTGRAAGFIVGRGVGTSASVTHAASPAVAGCGRSQRYAKPRMKMETKPPVRIHFRLSRRAGMVVALAEAASADGASAREFTEVFCESSPPPAGALEPPAGPPPPLPCDAEGMGAVPETLISI